jgi:hypothetical protein
MIINVISVNYFSPLATIIFPRCLWSVGSVMGSELPITPAVQLAPFVFPLLPSPCLFMQIY